MVAGNKYDLLIVGAGPAGLAAAIYAARASLTTLVIDEASAGGQVKTTHMVANYPGFVEPIAGHILASNMYKQALRYGAEFELAADISAICLTDREKWIELDGEDRYTGDAVILATGSTPRRLNIPGEQEFKGHGLSYCATCDAEFFLDRDIVVIGGGNSAMEESLLLLQFVRSITVVHQFDQLQAERVTANKVTENPKVDFLWSHEPRSFRRKGDRMIVEVEDLKTGERTDIERDGVFIFVGMEPNSDYLRETPIRLTKEGYVPTGVCMETNIEGVFAAGDVCEKRHRQIATAVGDGTTAALEVIRSL